jgi:hypothetical protein
MGVLIMVGWTELQRTPGAVRAQCKATDLVIIHTAALAIRKRARRAAVPGTARTGGGKPTAQPNPSTETG